MSYGYIYETAQKIQLGWADEASDVVFGGLSLSGHYSGLADYEQSVDRVAGLENELAGVRAERDMKLIKLGDANRQAYYGLLGTPSYGEDCTLLPRWGYTRRSDRSSGLTRSQTGQTTYTSGEAI